MECLAASGTPTPHREGLQQMLAHLEEDLGGAGCCPLYMEISSESNLIYSDISRDISRTMMAEGWEWSYLYGHNHGDNLY